MSNIVTVLESQIIEPINKEELPVDDGQKLLNAFKDCTSDLYLHLDTAKKIKVDNVDDKESMKAARETRLHLKNIRVEVEKKRKELKEDSLRYGRAIDGVANILKQMIEPIENYLLKQEEFAIEQERVRLRELVMQRESELLQLEVDTTHFDLSNMAEDAFSQLLTVSKIAFNMKKKAEAEAEEQRISKEKAEQIERERIQKENEDLKKQQAIRDIELAAERKKFEDARLKREQEIEKKIKEEADRREAELARIEKERIQKEADAAKAHKQAALAPDKEKFVTYANMLQSVELPNLQNSESKELLIEVQILLTKVIEIILIKSVNL